MALSTSVNWISNFIVAFITPPLFSALHGGYYFLLLGSCLISGVIVWLLYPETAGKTLEELGEVFGDGVVTAAVDEEVGRMRLSQGPVGTVAEPLEVAAVNAKTVSSEVTLVVEGKKSTED